MDSSEAWARLAGARVARLATITKAGRPHVVPIVFAIEGEVLYFAVDSKPKRTNELQRLKNITAHPDVSLLVDHYEDERWAELWWVRADGTARVVDEPSEAERAIDRLAEKYSQHRQTKPRGPVVVVQIKRVTGWSGA